MSRSQWKQPFLGLHWKGFLWVSLLLIGLSSVFYILNHYYLTTQFRSQRQTEVMYLKRQVDVLLNHTTDRLVRLSGALASIFDVDETPDPHKIKKNTDLNPPNANYTKLGFELDIHEIGFSPLTPAWPGIGPNQAISALLRLKPGCIKKWQRYKIKKNQVVFWFARRTVSFMHSFRYWNKAAISAS